MRTGKLRSYLIGGVVVIFGSFAGLVLIGAIVGDSANVGTKADNAVQQKSVPRIAGKLNEERQQARYQTCLRRMDKYEELRVWKHGGARPGVDASAWRLLTADEKDEVFDIAGCIAAGGQVGERIVTVTEEGGAPEIETRRVANDRDFAAEIQ